ncbi:hypothetical protein [Anthocerotibacter panamensis]|uniref:hypothetical protein n=1 Tax=Anthocerotibacter panamensis TaxID=2857077 RepID=UPI001C406095|nr:hypothetical protein [Anthocerotibacter panamensis]
MRSTSTLKDTKNYCTAKPSPWFLAVAVGALLVPTAPSVAQATQTTPDQATNRQSLTQGKAMIAPTREELQQLQTRLQNLEQAPVEYGYPSGPGISIATPTGFGASNNIFFLGVGYNDRIRTARSASDGAFTLGYGFFDPRVLAVELSYTVLSTTGRTSPFGSGGFNLKVHHQFSDDFAVAAGWNGFVSIGTNNSNPLLANDLQNTVYVAATGIIHTQENIDAPFSRIALSAGVGGGAFRPVSDIFNGVNSVGVFGSAAIRVIQPISAIVEWTGQDLAAGLSIAPFPNLGFVITPAFRDLAGVSNIPGVIGGARFTIGAGFAFQF